MTLPTRLVGDLNVSAIGLGAMTLTQIPGYSAERAIQTVHAAIDSGVTFFDTADCYGDRPGFGINETLLYRALKSRPGDSGPVLIATKVGHYRVSQSEWAVDGRPQYLKAAAVASLQRLGGEALPLLQLHRPDPGVPFHDSIGALKELRDDGLVQRVGLCNVDVGQVESAYAILGSHLVSVQNQLSPLHHDEEDLLGLCERRRLAFLPWAPLGGMRQAKELSGKSPTVARIAISRGVSPQRVVLAWLLARSSCMIPIPGASRPESVRDSAEAARMRLEPNELAQLNADLS